MVVSFRPAPSVAVSLSLSHTLSPCPHAHTINFLVVYCTMWFWLQVASVLAKHPCTLVALTRLTEMSLHQVRKCLLVLMQHHIVTYTELRRPFYRIDLQVPYISHPTKKIPHARDEHTNMRCSVPFWAVEKEKEGEAPASKRRFMLHAATRAL